MKIQYKNFRITDEKLPYGFKAQVKIGSQWKHAAYCTTLGQILHHVFEQAYKEEFKDYLVDLESFEKTASSLKILGERLDSIKSEILEAANV